MDMKMRIFYILEKNVIKNYKNEMIYIKLNRDRRISGKWDCVNTKLNTHDVTSTFRGALVYLLWNYGMSFKKAASLLKINPDTI